jgi:hypothetical protein
MTYASGALIKTFFHSERKTSKTKRGCARFGASGVAGARYSIRVSPVFCAGADLFVHAPGASRESRADVSAKALSASLSALSAEDAGRRERSFSHPLIRPVSRCSPRAR